MSLSLDQAQVWALTAKRCRYLFLHSTCLRASGLFEPVVWKSHDSSNSPLLHLSIDLFKSNLNKVLQSEPKALDLSRHEHNTKLWPNVPNKDNLFLIWHIGSQTKHVMGCPDLLQIPWSLCEKVYTPLHGNWGKGMETTQEALSSWHTSHLLRAECSKSKMVVYIGWSLSHFCILSILCSIFAVE